jgi:hypothetical protein
VTAGPRQRVDRSQRGQPWRGARWSASQAAPPVRPRRRRRRKRAGERVRGGPSPEPVGKPLRGSVSRALTCVRTSELSRIHLRHRDGRGRPESHRRRAAAAVAFGDDREHGCGPFSERAKWLGSSLRVSGARRASREARAAAFRAARRRWRRRARA